MPSPSLFIKRLVVEGDLGCDFTFDYGMNVLAARQNVGDARLSNTCGKTTLIELIRCGLGRRYGGYADFPALEQLKTRVRKLWLEIHTNGEAMLIERSLDGLTGLIKLRWCTFDERATHEQVQDVTPAELSPIILDRLGIPDVSVKQGDGSMTPLSFPLLQRAFVLHQEDSFFAVLDKVDPPIRKTQVLGLLTQVRPLASFQLEPQLGQLQCTIKDIEDQIAGITAFLRTSGVANLVEAEAQLTTANDELNNAKRLQRAIQIEIREQQAAAAESGGGRTEALRASLIGNRSKEQALLEQISEMRVQELELNDLLGSLVTDRRKIRHLRASNDLLSTIDFRNCPRCLQVVTEEMRRREQHGRCSLCARLIARTSDEHPRAAPNEEDVASQVAETEKLLDGLSNQLTSGNAELAALRAEATTLATELDREMQAFVSPALDRFVQQADRVAQATAKVARVNALRDQTQALERLRERLVPLKADLRRSTAEWESLKIVSAQRIEALRKELENVLNAVRFPNLTSVGIDDATLMPIINGHSYQSEGTGLKGVVVLCYHLALFNLARRMNTYFPKILIIDSPAVGDLNEVNHTALLEYLSSLGSDTENQELKVDSEEEATDGDGDWQVLLTTRKMVPTLEPFVFENLSSPDRMLLRSNEARQAQRVGLPAEPH